MTFIKEIYHKENLDLNGKIITREAVRGIILKGKKVLMIFSSKNGDYKFPGGGVETGESYKETLRREIQEECGALVSQIERRIGKAIEYDRPIEKDYDVFKMTSYYYICKVEENYCDQNLDQYEKELDFKPVWVDVDIAIENNKSIMNSNSKEAPRWTKRDTFVLEQIKEIMEKEQKEIK